MVVVVGGVGEFLSLVPLRSNVDVDFFPLLLYLVGCCCAFYLSCRMAEEEEEAEEDLCGWLSKFIVPLRCPCVCAIPLFFFGGGRGVTVPLTDKEGEGCNICTARCGHSVFSGGDIMLLCGQNWGNEA